MEEVAVAVCCGKGLRQKDGGFILRQLLIKILEATHLIDILYYK